MTAIEILNIIRRDPNTPAFIRDLISKWNGK
jgi:uncharacterized protein (UPF0147 family)